VKSHETHSLGWLIITETNYYFNTTKHFYLDISVSTRNLHQKKLVQFFFRFLPG